MAIGTPTLATPQVGATSTSVAAASYTPVADSLYIAKVSTRGTSAAEPTLSDDIGSTWTAIAGTYITNGSARLKLFQQTPTGSPAARVVTAVSTSATQVGLDITEISGAAVNASNFHFDDTSGAGDGAVTMDAFGANSACYAGHASNAGTATTSPSGFTELFDTSIATNLRATTSYDIASPTTALTWTSSGAATVAFGLELVEASAGSTDALLADDVATGAPSVGSPVIGQIHALGANDVATAAPSVGSPVLGQVHALTADDVTTGVPTVGAPVLAEGGQVYVLVARGMDRRRRFMH